MDITQVTNEITPTVAVAIVAMVVAVIELVKFIFKRDWLNVALIISAGVVGLLVGVLLGANPIFSAILGLSASGVYKLTKNITSVG